MHKIANFTTRVRFSLQLKANNSVVEYTSDKRKVDSSNLSWLI